MFRSDLTGQPPTAERRSGHFSPDNGTRKKREALIEELLIPGLRTFGQ